MRNDVVGITAVLILLLVTAVLKSTNIIDEISIMFQFFFYQIEVLCFL